MERRACKISNMLKSLNKNGFVSQFVCIVAIESNRQSSCGNLEKETAVEEVSPKQEVSLKQLEANRQNAQKSGGPRTEGGKIRSSQNALTHALTADRVIINGEDGKALEQLFDELIEEHQPEGTTEILLVREMTMASWRLRRTDQIEAQSFESGAYALSLDYTDKKIRDARIGWMNAERTGLMADRVTTIGLHASGERQTAEGLAEIQEAYENTIEENQLVRDKNAPSVLKDLGNPATVFRWMTNNQNIMDTLQRYRTSAERSFYRALDKLTHLQEKRRTKNGSAAPIVDVKADETSVA